jgi:pimeloyl-ACP methyl ester carboxylesterase
LSIKTTHRTGTTTSGDVELFYRRFGQPGETPVLILHGANYYDSYDWIDIASELAEDRTVVAFDARGYGKSTWSPSQDYSLDAQLKDIQNLLDHLGWGKAIIVGHSRGGSFGLRLAAEHPDRVAGLVLVDYSPGHQPGGTNRQPAVETVAGAPLYATLADALGASSRDPRSLESPFKRARLEAIFAKRGNSWVNVARDPAYAVGRPADRPGWTPTYGAQDLWDALAAASAPLLVIRAKRSAVYDDQTLARVCSLSADATVVEVDSGHDVPGEAPAEMADAISAFLPWI